MATTKSSPRFQVGDRVKIRYSDWQARIIEFRGALGPGGAFVYRVRVPEKPKPRYIELLEDQLIAIPTPTKVKPSPDGETLPKATTATLPLFRKGERVQIRDSNWQGRIVELLIPSAPGRVFVYRVRVPAEPRSIYLEIPENYLISILTPVKKKLRPSARRRGQDAQKREG